MLSTYHLSFKYEQSNGGVNDISLTLEAGKITGLIGANGSGKSTLLMLLLGILKPQSGTVCWNNEPISYKKEDLYTLRQNVSMVFQEPDQQLFYTDAKADISFSLRNLGFNEAEIEKRMNEAIRLVGAEKFIHQPLQHLSFGQKKRIAIASALVLNAPCILLDEPTAGLDPLARESIIAILQKLIAQGKQVLISSHDIDLIYELCHNVYVLHKGKMVLNGITEDVFSETQTIRQAGLVQPWLMKLHLQKGLPLFKTESSFFHDKS